MALVDGLDLRRVQASGADETFERSLRLYQGLLKPPPVSRWRRPGELERVCRDASAPLVLDMTHLMNAGDCGVATLRCLVVDGARVTAMSP